MFWFVVSSLCFGVMLLFSHLLVMLCSSAYSLSLMTDSNNITIYIYLYCAIGLKPVTDLSSDFFFDGPYHLLSRDIKDV